MLSIIIKYEDIELEYHTDAFETVEEAMDKFAEDKNEFICNLLSHFDGDYLANEIEADLFHVRGITNV